MQAVETMPLVRQRADHPLAWATIMAEVAEKHRLTIPQLLAHRRQRDLVRARDELFYRLFRETSLSYPDMGRKCGDFDHSSVMIAVRRHQARLAAQ